MATTIIASSLASATLADLKRAAIYIRAATWIGQSSDGDQIKIVYERTDGDFDTFTLADLRGCARWRLGRPDDVVFIEALMKPEQLCLAAGAVDIAPLDSSGGMADFLAGRDLALALLREATAAADTNLFCIEAEFRDGAPQNNIVLSCLRRVSSDPRLADGFAAVISDSFFAGITDIDRYAQLSFEDMRIADRKCASSEGKDRP